MSSPAVAEGVRSPVLESAGEVQRIPLELCQPAPYNPRQFAAKPNQALVELAASIRSTGQVQPATVRPLADGKFEIVAGECRWRACRLRGKGEAELVPADAWVGEAEQAATLVAAGPPVEHLSALVRELTDEQAMEICAVENLEREELAPLEEAAGVATLLQLYHGDVEAVAARVSRPVSWVAARARLTTLSKKWQQALVEEGRGFQAWTAAHLVEIAKLAPAAQDELLAGEFHYPDELTVSEVRKTVIEALRTLSGAPFDILDASILPKVGACSTCPQTSAHTPGLFADEGDELRPSELAKARCLNPSCWREKAVSVALAKVNELRREHADAALVYSDYDDKEELPQKHRDKARRVNESGAKGWGQYLRVKAATKGAWPGVYFTGPKAGAIEWFQVRSKADATAAAPPAKSRSGTAGGVAVPVTPLADRRKALDRRRIVAAVGYAQEAIETCTAVPPAEVLLTLALVFGTKARFEALHDHFYDLDEESRPTLRSSSRDRDRWKAYDAAASKPATDRGGLLWRKQLRPVLLSRLNYLGTHTDVDKLLANAKRIGDLVGVDVDALHRKAIEELPEPKSWAKLAEQERAAKKAAKATTPSEPNGKRRPKSAAADQEGGAQVPTAAGGEVAPRRRRRAAQPAAPTPEAEA